MRPDISFLIFAVAAEQLSCGVSLGQESGISGQAIYAKQCASCHGKQGDGTKSHPQPLAGERRRRPSLAHWLRPWREVLSGYPRIRFVRNTAAPEVITPQVVPQARSTSATTGGKPFKVAQFVMS